MHLKSIVNPKYDGYHWRLASMIYKCFDKKSKVALHVLKQKYKSQIADTSTPDQ